MSVEVKKPVSTEKEIENLDALIGFEMKLFAFERLIKDSTDPAQLKAYEGCLSLRRYVLEYVQEYDIHQSIYFAAFNSLINKMLKDLQHNLQRDAKIEHRDMYASKENVAEKKRALVYHEDLDLNGMYADFMSKYTFSQHLKDYTIFPEFTKIFESIKASVEEYVQQHSQYPDLIEARKFFVEKSNQLKSAIAECVLIGRYQRARTPNPNNHSRIRHS